MMKLFVAILITVQTIAEVKTQCPFSKSSSNKELHQGKSLIQNYHKASSRSSNINYAHVKEDLITLFRSSHESWPADYGHYGPFMIRLAWHNAGSYRTSDGRGGADGARQRFEPERSWDDNTNLDKARSLLWDIKYKYGPDLSWGDLFVMAGNVAIESMGGTTLGFCAGRVDVADGSESIQLGPSSEQQDLFPCDKQGECDEPLGANTVGLIYVNPAGHLGNGDPVESASDIRDVFGRMDMNDTETVALIGGGHSVGKCHGACPDGPGPSPADDPLNPWPGNCRTGKLMDAYTSGFELTFTSRPTVWDTEYFHNLLTYNWEKENGPGEKVQWKPVSKDGGQVPMAPTADLKTNVTIGVLTSDVALINDKEYMEIVQQFADDRASFDQMFSHAWYKLTTRDMGPRARCLNDDAPPAQDWQFPLPERQDSVPDFAEVRQRLESALDGEEQLYGQFARLAWQCSSTFRVTDYQGGCNGARIRLSPAREWEVNKNLNNSLAKLEDIKEEFGSGLSMADLIVLAGTTALNRASDNKLNIPFCGVGRVDDDKGQAWRFLEPRVSGQFDESVTLLKDYISVMGLGMKHFAALMGAGYSLGQSSDCAGLFCNRLSYASPATPSTSLSNKYFTDLLNNQWSNTTVSGRQMFQAVGSNLLMYKVDIYFKTDPELSAIAMQFAENEQEFFSSLSEAWSLLMSADMYSGPDGNLCADHDNHPNSAPPSHAILPLLTMLSLILTLYK